MGQKLFSMTTRSLLAGLICRSAAGVSLASHSRQQLLRTATMSTSIADSLKTPSLFKDKAYIDGQWVAAAKGESSGSGTVFLLSVCKTPYALYAIEGFELVLTCCVLLLQDLANHCCRQDLQGLKSSQRAAAG